MTTAVFGLQAAGGFAVFGYQFPVVSAGADGGGSARRRTQPQAEPAMPAPKPKPKKAAPPSILAPALPLAPALDWAAEDELCMMAAEFLLS